MLEEPPTQEDAEALLPAWDLLEGPPLRPPWHKEALSLIAAGALPEALGCIPPGRRIAPADLRRLACVAAQAAVDLQVERTPTDLFCAIALQRLIEHVAGDRSADDLDGASFLARSSVASGGGLAAEAVLAACTNQPKEALFGAVDALAALIASPRDTRSPALDAIRLELRALVAALR